MALVSFMTNTCGWGLKFIDGCNLGRSWAIQAIHIRAYVYNMYIYIYIYVYRMYGSYVIYVHIFVICVYIYVHI